MTCALLIAMAMAVRTADEPTQSLIAEVIAGCEANLAKIQHGTASYTVTVKEAMKPREAREGNPNEWKFRPPTYGARIWFTPSRVRWDEADARCLRDETTDTEYTPAEGAEPPHHIALIDELGQTFYHPSNFHPKSVGHSYMSDRHRTIGDYLRDVSTNPELSLVAVRTGSEITVRLTWRKAGAREDFVVAPAQGYGLLSFRQILLRRPEPPMSERTAEYREVNGAYVASRLRTVVWVKLSANARHQVLLDQTTVLDAIDLDDEPSAKKFRLADLGLPKGARVLDKRTGKYYLWGIDLTTEEDIEDALTHILLMGDRSPYLQSKPGRRWLYWYVLPAIAALVAASVVVWRVRRRSESSRG